MKNYAIGCDLGGTNLRVGVVDVQNGKVIYLQSIPTLAREGYVAVIARMAKTIQDVINHCKFSAENICGVGIGAPAVLNPEEGIVLLMPNLYGGWRDVPLGKLISDVVQMPVHLINDVRAATFGEWKYGAGKNTSTMVCFSIGTGIGGGVVLNNELVMNFHGTAGELGHVIIDPNGPECGCGNHGCLEAYASGPALAAMGIKAVKQGRTTIIGDLVKFDLNLITAEVIAQAARQGDHIAREIYEYVGSIIGVAAANVSLAIGPERIVICGGVAGAGDLLLNPIKETIQKRIFVLPKEKIMVVTGDLGDEAGILGSANWASLKENQRPCS